MNVKLRVRKKKKVVGQVTDALKKRQKNEYCLLQCGTSDFLTSIVK